MAERYTHPTALRRMALGACPECGYGIEAHSGWGGPACSLTDNGVAQRLAQYREDGARCAFVSDGEPGRGDHHSDDLVTVYHGSAEPITVCGYHSSRPEIMETVFAQVHRDG